MLDASHCVLRGLIIDGFGIGVSVPNPGDVGNLIQGNFIGKYFLYPVDPTTGAALARAQQRRSWPGWATRSRASTSTRNNTTVGGTNPQENNVIAGNGVQGIWIDAGGHRQRDRGQPDRHDRTVDQRPLFPGRQRRRGRPGATARATSSAGRVTRPAT